MYQEYNGNDHRRYQRDPRETSQAAYYESSVHFREPRSRDAYSSSSSDEDESYEEPPWAGQVNDKGDLFYIETLREPSPPPLNDIDSLHITGNSAKEKNRDVFKKLNNVKKILPNLKREKSNEKKTDEKNLKNSLTVDGNEMPKGHDKSRSSRSIKKDIHVIVTPPKLGTGRHQDLETLLGIIPGRDKTGRLSQNDSYSGCRIYIKGFVPDGAALKCGQLRIGDIILSLNKLDLNSSNVHTILAAITGPMEIILTIQRFHHPPKPANSPSHPTQDDSHLIKLISGPPSSNIKTDLRGLHHAVFYLSMTSSEDDEPNKDILYQSPLSEEANQLLSLRGVFLTLSDLLVSVTGTTPQSSTIMIQKKLVNVGYHKTGKQQVMIICLPSDKVSLVHLQKLMSDITRVLNLIFGSVERAFCGRGNKSRLDHFFSLLFESLLATKKERNSNNLYDCLSGVQWLNLPTTTMVNVNCCLSDLEAGDYGELVDELFQIRRLYTILGSCIFYKGMLLANHLISEDFQDILLYCKYYCLLDVGQKQRIGQLVVWKEIFLTRKHKRDNRTEYREPTGRHFVLIVGQKHMLLCVLLEAGGVARKAEGYPRPDSYYVEQLKNTLMQIETLDIASVCEASVRSTPNPPIISADVVLSSSAVLTVADRNSLGLVAPATPPQGRRYGSLDSLKLPGDELDSSDSGSLPFKRRGSDSSGSASSLSAKGKMRSYRSLSSLNCVGTLRKSFAESPFDLVHSHASRLTGGKENTLFNFVAFDAFTGVLMCPTSNDTVPRCGSVHTEVIQTFYNTCLTIRRNFLPYYKQRLKSSSNKNKSYFSNRNVDTVIEHGVQFQRVPDCGTEQKKAVPALKYWVVGRLFPGDHPKEFYVCYHSKIPQDMDGVILGADTRATEDTVVADKNCAKIHYIAPNIYCCGAGTAADTENVTDLISSQIQLHSLSTGRQARVVTALRMLKQRLFRYQGYISAALVLGGVDFNGPKLHTVYPHGSTDSLPYVTMGSGSLAAMSVFESRYRPDMELEEAKQLVRDGIAAGIFNDLGSGSNVDLCIITKEGVNYIRPYDVANVKGERQGKYTYKRGTTAVLTKNVTPIKVDITETTASTSAEPMDM